MNASVLGFGLESGFKGPPDSGSEMGSIGPALRPPRYLFDPSR